MPYMCKNKKIENIKLLILYVIFGITDNLGILDES